MRPQKCDPRCAASRPPYVRALVTAALLVCLGIARAQDTLVDPLHRARWDILAGRVDEAIAAYTLVLERAPDDVESRVWRARLYGWRSRHADAERDYRRVLARNPRDWDARLGLARARSAQDAPEEAEQILRELRVEEPREISPALLLAHLYLRAGRFAAAEREFEAALAIEPTDPTARASLGTSIYAQNQPERARRADLTALDALDARLTVRPYDEEARVARARVLARLARPEDAAADLDALLAEEHSYGEAELLRAQVELRLGHPDEALRRAEALLATDPRWHEARVLLGDALFRLGEREQAEHAYRIAFELQPHDAEPLLGLARVREADGDIEGAKEAVEQALALQPGRRDAREMLAHLDATPPRTPWRIDLAARYDDLDRGQPSWWQESAWARWQASPALGLTLGIDSYERAERDDLQLSGVVDWRFATGWSVALLYAYGFEAEVVAQSVAEVELARGFGESVGLLRWRHSEFEGAVHSDMLSPGWEFPLGDSWRVLARYYLVDDSAAGTGHAGSLRADLGTEEPVRYSLGVAYGVESFLADSIDQVVRGGTVLTLSAGASWRISQHTRLWIGADWEDHEEAYEKLGVALGISLEL